MQKLTSAQTVPEPTAARGDAPYAPYAPLTVS